VVQAKPPWRPRRGEPEPLLPVEPEVASFDVLEALGSPEAEVGSGVPQRSWKAQGPQGPGQPGSGGRRARPS